MTYTAAPTAMLMGIIDGEYCCAAFAFTTFIWCFLYNDLREKNGIWEIQEDIRSSDRASQKDTSFI